MQAIFDVTSFSGLGYSEGAGFLAYNPLYGRFEFTANAYQHYEDRKKNMMKLRDHQFMSVDFNLIAALRVEGSADDDGKEFDLLNKIDYFLFSRIDYSLTFRFKNSQETVKITFADYHTGCKLVVEIFKKANIKHRIY